MVRVLTILLSLFLSQYVVNDTFLYHLGPFCLFLSALQPSISLLFPLFPLLVNKGERTPMKGKEMVN